MGWGGWGGGGWGYDFHHTVALHKRKKETHLHVHTSLVAKKFNFTKWYITVADPENSERGGGATLKHEI